MTKESHLVRKCCGSSVIEPDWEMAEKAGSLWRAFACYICKRCGKECEVQEQKDAK